MKLKLSPLLRDLISFQREWVKCTKSMHECTSICSGELRLAAEHVASKIFLQLKIFYSSLFTSTAYDESSIVGWLIGQVEMPILHSLNEFLFVLSIIIKTTLFQWVAEIVLNKRI